MIGDRISHGPTVPYHPDTLRTTRPQRRADSVTFVAEQVPSDALAARTGATGTGTRTASTGAPQDHHWRALRS
jgi:hypothetical protein